MPLEDLHHGGAQRAEVLEIGLDESLAPDAEVLRQLRRQPCLAARRDPGQLALVPERAEAARLGGVRIGECDAVPPRAVGQHHLAAIVAFELAVLQRADRIADIVAEPVRRIDQRLRPVGEEQRVERVRLVVVGEMEFHVRAERIFVAETVGAEQLRRIADAGAICDGEHVALRALAAVPAPRRVVEVAQQLEAQILRRKGADAERYHVDVVA